MSARARTLAAAVGAAAVLVLTGCGGEQPASAPAPSTSSSTSSSTSPSTSPSTATSTAAPTDESACAGFGDAGVEQRLGEVYDDEAASRALVEEYAGAPRFQEGLRQTLELLRSSGGELEGDFLAQACGS